MAKKTILRKANTQEIANVNEDYINMAEWTGLNDSTNYTSVDQSSFSEADNVYVDDENELRNRPPIISTQPFETIECNDLEDNTYVRKREYGDDTPSSIYETGNSHGSAEVTYEEPEPVYEDTWYDAYDNTGIGTYDDDGNIISVLINKYTFTDFNDSNESCTLTYTEDCYEIPAPDYVRRASISSRTEIDDRYYYVNKIVIESTTGIVGQLEPSTTVGVFDTCVHVTELYINCYIASFSRTNLVFSNLGTSNPKGVYVYFNGSKLNNSSEIPSYCFYSDNANYVLPYITSVTFNTDIPIVGTYAFAYTKIPAIDLGTSVTTVNDYAFYECPLLVRVVATNAQYYGSHCFYDCVALSSISVTNVDSLGDHCFYNCTSLLSNTFNNLLAVSDYCFYNCTKLTTVYATKATSLGVSSFRDCTSLTDIDISSAITIGNYCFYNCTSLTNLDFSNIINIGEYAFYRCYNLSEIDLPKVQFLYMCCFCESGLKKVNIGNTLTTVGTHIFEGVTTLEELDIPFIGPDAGIRTASQDTLLGYLFSSSSSNGLITCTQTITGSDSYISYIPENLKTVWVKLGTKEYASSYSGNYILSGTFSDCIMLNLLIIGDDSYPDNIYAIDNYACYNCTGLTMIVLGHNIQDIRENAFANNTALDTVFMPKSMSIVRENAFSNCNALDYARATGILYEGTEDDRNNIDIELGGTTTTNGNLTLTTATWTYDYEYEVGIVS